MKIQLDIPEKLNKKIAVHSIKNDFNDKRKAIIDILMRYFKENK